MSLWIKLGSFMMLLAVALGAFGAHILKTKITSHSLEIYKIGVLYHIVHALGLFIVAWLCTVYNDPKLAWAGLCMVLGIALFSGSLYILAVAGVKWVVLVTPLGGIAFLLGWILIFFAREIK